MVAVAIIIQRIGLKRCSGWVKSHAILLADTHAPSVCESSSETFSDKRVSPSWSPSRDIRSGAERDKKGDLLPAFARVACSAASKRDDLKLLQTRELPGAFMQRWKKLKSFGGSGEVDPRPLVWMCCARNKRRRTSISPAAKLQSNLLITILDI